MIDKLILSFKYIEGERKFKLLKEEFFKSLSKELNGQYRVIYEF